MDKISESIFEPIQPNELDPEVHDDMSESKWLLTASEHSSLSTIPPAPFIHDSEEKMIDDEIEIFDEKSLVHFAPYLQSAQFMGTSQDICNLLVGASSNKYLSLIVHRIGSALVLDGELPASDIPQPLLMYLAKKGITDFSSSTSSTSSSSQTDQQKQLKSLKKYICDLSKNVDEDLTSDIDHTANLNLHPRIIKCNINGYKIIIQSNAPLVLESNGSISSYFVHDVKKALTAEMLSSFYLESILNNAKFSIINTYDSGKIVKSEKYLTSDMPNKTGSLKDVLRENSKTLFEFLQSECKEDTDTYWIFREEGGVMVRLFNLSSLNPSKKQQSYWKYMIATMCLRYAQTKDVEIDNKLLLLKKAMSLFQELNDIDDKNFILLINVHSQLSQTYLQLEKEKIDKKDAKERLEYIENAIDNLTQAITLIRHKLEIRNENNNDNNNGDNGDNDSENQNDDEIEETIYKDLKEKLNNMRYDCFLCYIRKSQIHLSQKAITLSLSTFDAALTLTTDIESHMLLGHLGDIFFEISQNYKDKHNIPPLSQYKNIFEIIQKKSLDIELPKGDSLALIDGVECYSRLSLYCYNQALQSPNIQPNEKYQYYHKLGYTYNELGRSYMKERRYYDSIDAYDMGIQSFMKIGDVINIGLLYYNSATLMKHIALQVDANDEVNLQNEEMLEGPITVKQNDCHIQSIRLCEEGINILSKSKNEDTQRLMKQLLSEKAMCSLIYGVRLYNQLKHIYIGNYNSTKQNSLYYLENALEIYQSLENYNQVIALYYHLGVLQSVIYQTSSNMDQKQIKNTITLAKFYFTKCFDMLLEYGQYYDSKVAAVLNQLFQFYSFLASNKNGVQKLHTYHDCFKLIYGYLVKIAGKIPPQEDYIHFPTISKCANELNLPANDKYRCLYHSLFTIILRGKDKKYVNLMEDIESKVTQSNI